MFHISHEPTLDQKLQKSISCQRTRNDAIKLFLQEQQTSQSAATWNLSRQNLKKLLRYQSGIADNSFEKIIKHPLMPVFRIHLHY